MYDTSDISHASLKSLPDEEWANRADKYVGCSKSTGHDRSSDAIDGYYGIQWWEVYTRKDGTLYKVRCYDGTNRSKDAYYIADGHTDFCICSIAGPGTDDDHCTCMTEEELGLLEHAKSGAKAFKSGFKLMDLIRKR